MDLSGSWEYAKRIAESRLANNKTQHHVSEYGEGIELIGVLGEIAARRYLGLREKLHVNWDGGVDINFDGMTIDVKATLLTPKVKFRFLQWPINKPIKSDYILMAAVDPVTKQAVILGYATRSEVQKAKINYDRAYACREISVQKLHPAYDLVAMRLKNISRGKNVPQTV